jgi:membrane-bound lytic murein transglycosylase C
MSYNQKVIFYLSFFVLLLLTVSIGFLLGLKDSSASIEIPESRVLNLSGLHGIVLSEVNSSSPKKQAISITKFNQPNIPNTLKQAVYQVKSTDSQTDTSDKEAKVYQNLLPSLVIHQDEIVIEFAKKIATSQNIKQAIVRVLLSKDPLNEANLLSKKSYNLKTTPYFYKKVTDQNRYAIRYPKQAYDYARYILENNTEGFADNEGDFVLVHIPFIQSDLTGVAQDYQNWVEEYSTEYDISPALVYAIMETESSFNPKAISRSNAIGLMQLKPNAAGKDVHNLIDLKPGKPSKRDLFDSKNNIRMGSAYLGLLSNDYLSDVENEKIREMMSISSYNGGLSTVLKLFGKTPESAIKKVNRMHPKQVYKKLRFEHKSAETRKYLDKVLAANLKYKEQLNIPIERY